MMEKFNKNNHVMIDIETLGTGSAPVVVQISAVQFNPFTGETFAEFDRFINIQDSLNNGCTVTEGTIKFWLEQDADAIVSVFFSGMPSESLRDVLNKFRYFLEQIGFPPVMWGKGPSFDLAKLSNIYSLMGMEKPWDFWNEKCVRTIQDLYPSFKKEIPFTGIKHNGIDDAKHQIKIVHANINQLYTERLC